MTLRLGKVVFYLFLAGLLALLAYMSLLAVQLSGWWKNRSMTHRERTVFRTVTDELARAERLARAMIDEYVGWRGKVRHGEESHYMYMAMLDFVNFRVETADSCLLLIEHRRISDALGLCRSLFENYLLLMLMCRGTKLFRLEDLSSLSEGVFKQRLAEKHAELLQLQADGKTSCLAVKRYPRAKRHLMYVFEGLRSQGKHSPG